ncbi:MAG: hypothetical protein M3Q65_21920, partial [Chloroflexota bacterium]|nr:hypothetical protein [Chloroflexota bacterium]
ITCEIPTAELRAVEHQLPRLTRGDGDWVSNFAGYVPVTGEAPVRARVGPNPLNRAYHLNNVARALLDFAFPIEMPRDGLRVNPESEPTRLTLGEVGRGPAAHRAPRGGGDGATQGHDGNAGGTRGV